MMNTLFKTSALTLTVTLTACATAPSSMLTEGIDTSKISAADATQLASRSAQDPVCTKFYANSREYLAQSAKPNQGQNFLTQLGVSVLAGVATGGVVSGISGQAARIAAGQVTSQAIYTGSGMAIKGLRNSNGAEAKVIQTAETLGCPVTLAKDQALPQPAIPADTDI